jgi:hypothetical protein
LISANKRNNGVFIRGLKIKKQDLCTSFRGGASKLPPKKRKVVYKSPSITELLLLLLILRKGLQWKSTAKAGITETWSKIYGAQRNSIFGLVVVIGLGG